MSYDISFCRFERGGAAPVDEAALLAAVAPFVVDREPVFHFLRLRTPDGGEAEVYTGRDVGPLMGFTLSRFSGGAVSDLIVAVARATDTVILAPGCPTLVMRADQRQHLPTELAEHAVIVATGADFDAVLRAG